MEIHWTTTVTLHQTRIFTINSSYPFYGYPFPRLTVPFNKDRLSVVLYGCLTLSVSRFHEEKWRRTEEANLQTLFKMTFSCSDILNWCVLLISSAWYHASMQQGFVRITRTFFHKDESFHLKSHMSIVIKIGYWTWKRKGECAWPPILARCPQMSP